MNNAALKKEYFEDAVSSVYKHSISVVNVSPSETGGQTAVRYHVIARQAEEACHLDGNICGPELDYFEEKYGICDFA